MTPSLQEFLSIDLPAALAAVLACVSCSLVGSFLVLRRQALLGDAVSHVVLPGIVGAWIVTGTISSIAMMTGAMLTALIAVAMIECIRRLGQLDPGAAMGTVFTVMFALGVMMLERGGAARVHLDTSHALFGSLELVLWVGPRDSWLSLFEPAVLGAVPRQLVTLFAVTVLVTALCLVFFRELRLTTFDADFAASIGVSPRLFGIGLTVVTGITAVAAFEAVGSILVIAMFVSPPSAARMLTDRLDAQLWLAAALAAAAGLCGYLVAAFGPLLYGSGSALNAAGMIAVVAGLFQVLAMLFAPVHGVLSRHMRRAGTAT